LIPAASGLAVFLIIALIVAPRVAGGSSQRSDGRRGSLSGAVALDPGDLARRLDRSPPAICLLADLCRTGLLVKIEGVPL